ncbi:hypothetical protein QTG54_003496 [Skeletonema marinoi]|uniref:DUF2256 domain-containing protein n=1 Tax=Skeletonema marinoi TaxID=267567 RepID=A0AAD9DFT8_9STRA|nr:hypothetical protein QTG54_003496 [Skeletonema marinoi]|mmetsp:Transcript_14456/g.24591  ORF Transcript_14456/g.24591 Transcript_14456/m.24591 type:complete len:121 (-) Transcript_14456:1496-1858(-)
MKRQVHRLQLIAAAWLLASSSSLIGRSCSSFILPSSTVAHSKIISAASSSTRITTRLFGRGRGGNDKKEKKPSKSNLPEKICVVCNRPFTWRKKWERSWDEVTCCSKSCNAKRRSMKDDS